MDDARDSFNSRMNDLLYDDERIEKWYQDAKKVKCGKCQTHFRKGPKSPREEGLPECIVLPGSGVRCNLCRYRKVACPYKEEYLYHAMVPEFFEEGQFKKAYVQSQTKKASTTSNVNQAVALERAQILEHTTSYSGPSNVTGGEQAQILLPQPYNYARSPDPDLNTLSREALVDLVQMQNDHIQRYQVAVHGALAIDGSDQVPQVAVGSPLLLAIALDAHYLTMEQVLTLKRRLQTQPPDEATLMSLSVMETTMSKFMENLDAWSRSHGRG